MEARESVFGIGIGLILSAFLVTAATSGDNPLVQVHGRVSDHKHSICSTNDAKHQAYGSA
jgi:hypothetical protein